MFISISSTLVVRATEAVVLAVVVAAVVAVVVVACKYCLFG